jgi:hypothetical protein
MNPTELLPPNLMIGTPAYGGMVHTDYVNSLFGFTQASIRYTLMTIGNESLITRARNAVLAAFHARRDLTHLLFLDADVHLPAEGLVQMLAAGVPVIGAPVALKGRNAQGDRLWNLGRSQASFSGRGSPLLCVEHIGTAALMLSRSACDALVQDAIADGRVYARPSTSQGAVDADLHYDVFQVGVREGQYLSEDYWVCRRLRELGFDIYVDATVVTRHHGTVAV